MSSIDASVLDGLSIVKLFAFGNQPLHPLLFNLFWFRFRELCLEISIVKDFLFFDKFIEFVADSSQDRALFMREGDI